MPKIILKPNSPEFDDGQHRAPPGHHLCDMPSCPERGEYRAPKDRGLKEYYWFCLAHVQEYNKAWDFFSGMSPEDIEHHINTRTVWERPTRRYDAMAGFHGVDELRRKADRFQNFSESDEEDESDRRKNSAGSEYAHSTRGQSSAPAASPESEALRIMNLAPPLTLEKLNARYRELVKKYHPDHNRDHPEGEEILKQVNMAFTILKMAYKKYEDLTSKK